MKMAVIGLGAMGLNHVRVYKELGVLGAVLDVNQERMSEVSNQYDVRGFQNLDDLLKSSISMGIVAASIVVPTPLHAVTARTCIAHGLDLLIEKPICGQIDEAVELLSLSDKTEKILTVGYIERFNPAFLKLKQIVQSESFGEVISVSIKRCGGSPRTADNVIVDLMTHDLDLLSSLFGTYPDKISVNSHSKDGVTDSAQALLTFKNVSVVCDANWLSPTKIRKIQITGERKTCEANLISQEVVTNVSGHQEIFNFNKEPLREELSAFVEAVRTRDASRLASGEDALNALRLTLSVAQNNIS